MKTFIILLLFLASGCRIVHNEFHAKNDITFDQSPIEQTQAADKEIGDIAPDVKGGPL